MTGHALVQAGPESRSVNRQILVMPVGKRLRSHLLLGEDQGRQGPDQTVAPPSDLSQVGLYPAHIDD